MRGVVDHCSYRLDHLPGWSGLHHLVEGGRRPHCSSSRSLGSYLRRCLRRERTAAGVYPSLSLRSVEEAYVWCDRHSCNPFKITSTSLLTLVFSSLSTLVLVPTATNSTSCSSVSEERYTDANFLLHHQLHSVPVVHCQRSDQPNFPPSSLLCQVHVSIPAFPLPWIEVEIPLLSIVSLECPVSSSKFLCPRVIFFRRMLIADVL